MFEVKKALAHARAHVAVRLINLRYTEKGNLSGVVRVKRLRGRPARVCTGCDVYCTEVRKLTQWINKR